MLIPIQTFDQIDSYIQSHEGHRAILKHSNTCPVSATGLAQVEEALGEYPDVPVLILTVQSQRALSDQIEEQFEVRHESPQLLLFKGTKLKETKNHFSITTEGLRHVWGGGYAAKAA